MEKSQMKTDSKQDTLLDILSGSRILIGAGAMGLAAFLLASAPQAAERTFGGTAVGQSAVGGIVQLAQTDEEIEEMEDELDEMEDELEDELDEIEDEMDEEEFEDEMDEIEEDYEDEMDEIEEDLEDELDEIDDE